jgi:hypothetical protein
MFFGPNQFRIWQQVNPDTQELVGHRDAPRHLPAAPDDLAGRASAPAGIRAAHVHGLLDRRVERRHPDRSPTTHIKQGYFRRSGVPASDRTTVVEHWMRHGNLLSQVTIATDPVYLTEPYIRSQEFVMMERGNTNWLYNCEYAMEVPRDKNLVPHYLPGKNPWAGEFEAKHAMPRKACAAAPSRCCRSGSRARPGAAESRPRTAAFGRRAAAAAAPRARCGGEGAGQRLPDRRRRRKHRRAGGRRRRPGRGHRARRGRATRCWPPSRGSPTARRSAGSSTHGPAAEHIGNNEQVSRPGRTVNGNQAAIVAHENANERMIQRACRTRSVPYNTYFEGSRDFPFNGEPIILYHDESSVNDADTVVFFRRSDVVAAGDIFRTDSFPVIDVAQGGSIRARSTRSTGCSI